MDKFHQWEYKLGIYNNQQIDIKTQRKQKLEEYMNIQNAKKDEEERVDIMKDVCRTYQEMELFQLEENKLIMCNVLMVWCATSLSYRQGMNEIMGVIFYTYRESHPQITDSEEAESDLFWVLKAIMDGGNHREMFNYSANTKIDNTPIIKRIKEITSKLQDIDPELYKIFQQNQISTEIFLMRWLKCLLAREFEIAQIQQIWDCLFTYYKRNQLEFVDSIILAMMINLKSKMLQIEYINNFEVLLLFQNFPSKDQYKEILIEAKSIYNKLRKIAHDRETKTIEIIKSFNPNYAIVNIFRYLKKPIPENKYILLSTSKFWFNVRQAVNSLLIYQQLKQFGITDENIILMVPEDSACNRKNNDPGRICAYDDQQEPNLYKNVELDYKRNDVNIKYWIDIMRGKYDYYTPQSRRLLLSKENRLIMFINGHGGDGYTKMQDTQYLLDFEMAKITKEMAYLDLYKEAFLISDSCGAVTLYEKVEAPNMILLGSSSVTQKSYSKGKDDKLMMPKTDRFTYVTNEFLMKRVANDVTLTLQDQFDIYDPIEQSADSKLIINIPHKTAKDIKIADFWRIKPRKYLQVVRRRDDINRAKQQFLDSFG